MKYQNSIPLVQNYDRHNAGSGSCIFKVWIVGCILNFNPWILYNDSRLPILLRSINEIFNFVVP